MDLDLAFKAANLLASAIMVLGGLTQVLGFGQIKYLIVGAYVLTFGLANASLEFMPAHDLITRYLPFLFSFIGRGLFYIFVGSLIIGESVRSLSTACLSACLPACVAVRRSDRSVRMVHGSTRICSCAMWQDQADMDANNRPSRYSRPCR